ncbi:MAG: CpsD/CapB family tyrosine-protein kinase [Acidobacteria bacterium]|nr:CpsD/CapB family tyrosine-protein kinase [Acidobacteriota bacterium]
MSRIHEALKKAEHERSVSGPQSLPLEATPGFEGVDPGVHVETISSAYAAAVAAPPMPPQALYSQCRQTNWSPDLKAMLFFNEDEHLVGMEEFRTLRSRLYHAREKMPLSKLLISSPLPREGKSFTAANLAQVLVRQHGKRALLVDGDLRNAQLHRLLGAEPTPGVSDYLHGAADEFSIMQRGPMENLFLIPAGRSNQNPAELVANGRMKLLFDRVEPLFDWIIVDSPPAALVSDAGLLAGYCDAVLLILRSNTTPVDAARRAAQEFPAEKLLGTVLNGIAPGLSPYTQYYYSTYSAGNGNSRSAK